MAKKDTYYFSHDCNARRDEKIIALRIKYKWEGYGLFWGIIEHLRESENYECVRDYNIIAYDLRVGAELIKSIVEDFGLFSFTEDGKRFYSERLKKDMAIRADISSKRSAAGKKGGGNPNFKKGQKNIYYQSVDQLDSGLSEWGADEGYINKTLTRDKQDINYKKESKRKEIYKESISEDIPKKIEVSSATSPLSETDNSLTVEKKECNVSDFDDREPIEESVEEKPKREKASMPTPYEEIKTLWNKTDHGLPKVLVLSKARKSKMHLRFLEMGKDRDGGAMSVIKTVFKKVSESPFLKGENGRGWKASFDWVFENGENWLKIYEGNYDERKGKGGKTRPNECRGRETDRGADDGSSRTEESYIEFAKRGFK